VKNSFATLTPGTNIIKLFTDVIYEFLYLASVYLTRIDKLARDKHSSLLQKFVNYGRKTFYNIGPRPILDVFWKTCTRQ
jgi:hypothetical protein